MSPGSLRLPGDILKRLSDAGHEVEEHISLSEAVGEIDLVYATRVQTERFREGEMVEGYSENFRIDSRVVNALFGRDTVILHPLPRDSRPDAHDLSDDLDGDERLAIFRQTDNGMNIRMALFSLVMGVEDDLVHSMENVPWRKRRQAGSGDF